MSLNIGFSDMGFSDTLERYNASANPSVKRSCPAFPRDLTQVKNPYSSMIATDDPWAGPAQGSSVAIMEL